MLPKILIVDDHIDNVRLIEFMLDGLPLATDSASNGLEALDKINTQSYALILMDVQMPKMDGFECVAEIRKQKKFQHIPIIFLTAIGNTQRYVGQGYRLGAVDYIIKPVDEEALISKIKIFLELYRRQQETQEALAQVRELQRKYEQILNFTAEGIIGIDMAHSITFANTAACTLLTASQKELIGSSIKDIIAPDTSQEEWSRSDFVQILEDGQCHQQEDRFFWRKGSYQFPVQYTQSSIIENERVLGGVLVFQDISERKNIESRLVSLAKFDQLTGLANRTLYWEFLEKSIEVSKRGNSPLYLIFIDLDQFKEINDSLGHDAGDLLLIQASERLKSSLRSADLIARLGGDEFAVLIQQVNSEDDVGALAGKLIQTFSEPFQLYGEEVYIGCSAGIACCPNDGDDATKLTKAADTAMYNAKQSGRNTFRFFKSDMQVRVRAHLEIASELRQALRNDEIIPYFQPKVDLGNQKYVGAEALARWQHSTKGLVSPGIFIPVAEDSGLITPLGEKMLIAAGLQAKIWQNLMPEDSFFRISVNVAAKQLQNKDFAKNILSIIEKYDLNPSTLELELTETGLMGSGIYLTKALHTLRSEGIQISIDDFGTGYSSLAYLKRLPIDTLKIDQAFVRDIGEDSADESIIKAIIQMSHSLGLKVVAEGVETQEQLSFLEMLGCNYAQGFLFERPQPAQVLEATLRNFI